MNDKTPAPIVNLPTTANEQTSSMLQIIREVAMAPDASNKVDALKGMMEIQRELVKDQAERALNEAISGLDIPIVKKGGKIPLPSKDGSTRDVAFAKWPDIMRALQPILKAAGLSLSFTAPARLADGGGAAMTGRLSHASGAFRLAEISLPLDTGPGRNNLQAMGSTISYGKKYLAFMLLNIVTEDEDDDGVGAGYITEEQGAEIDKRLKAIGDDYRARFLKWAGVASAQEIPGNKFAKAIKEIEKKEAAVKTAQKKGAA